MTTRVKLDPNGREPLETPVPLTPEPRAERVPRPAFDYVELAARSNFSFLQAASPPEVLVQCAAELGYDAVGIADRDGLYGIVRAHEEAERQGLKLVIGCELTLDPEVSPCSYSSSPLGALAAWRPTLLVHVESLEGYQNLCKILTASHARYTKGKARGVGGIPPRSERDGVPRNCYAGIPLSFVCQHASGLWALADARLSSWGGSPDPEASRDLGLLRDAFGERASLGVYRHFEGGDKAKIQRAVRLSKRFGLPLCAHNAVRYARPDDKLVYDVVTCIREGLTLDRAGRFLSPNAEAHLKSEPDVRHAFANLGGFAFDHTEGGALGRAVLDVARVFARSREVTDACSFRIDELEYQFPFELDEPGFPGETPDQALRRLTEVGLRHRYGESGAPPSVREQIEKELAVIVRMDVAPYFLSVRSIVEIANRRDILCQGRGSAANSAVCYALGITAVDPSRSNLLFERFLSEERKEPPDIDVDFEHERREEVIQELYERYGRDRAAMVSEVISYRGKSALREVGKVFGLSLEQVDRMSTLVEWWDRVGDIDGVKLEKAGFDATDTRIKLALAMAKAIQGFPRHLSIHVGGFVLSAAPLAEVAPVEPATMPGRTVIPWDKDDLDTLGFFKVDVLALGMLTAIRKALDFVRDDPRVSAPTAIDRLARIPPEDPRVYEAIGHADTVGVFQIESRAQMAMLPRLKPKEFYDLVVEVAIVRPGPIQGGMVHPYLRRRSGQEPSDPPHPILEPILRRTLGVPLFQEQVMQIAIVGAGYTGGEADCLRRDMAAWRKNGRLERHKKRLHDGFLAHGISSEFANKLYAQIQGFGEYGFPESHAASFALLVYASSWLKLHHPAAFAAALVNSQPMGFYSPSTILQDAQKHGVLVLPIAVDASDWDSTLTACEQGEAGRGATAIRVGLRQVKGLGEATGRRIEAARKERAFASVEDLTARAALERDELEALAEAGALASLVRERREAIWKVHAPRAEALFEGVGVPEPPLDFAPFSRAEQLALDYARTGLSVDDHPMLLARPTLPSRVKSARQVAELAPRTRVSAAGLVICRQRPGTASGVVFITMEDETGFINLVVYSRIFDEFRHVATTSALLLAHGLIEREPGGPGGDPPAGEVVYVVVQKLEKLVVRSLGTRIDEVSTSRDFH
jgi:error-prone DNA polymerase